MSRTWSELLGDAEPGAGDDEERTGFFSRLRDSLAKSRRALTEQIVAAAFDPADDEAWERLEEALIRGDVGVPATAELVRRLEARGEIGSLADALAEEGESMFGEPATLAVDGEPSGLFAVGVHRPAKTTSSGKLPAQTAPHAAPGS